MREKKTKTLSATPLSEAIRGKVDKDLDLIANEILSSILHSVPVEGGHIHEAFISAHESVQLPEETQITSTLMAYDGVRSLDPKAQKAGVAKYTKKKKGVRLRVTVRLPFAAAMDSGDDITVGHGKSSTGYKVGGLSTMGQLYAPRKSSGPRGFLRWVDSSGTVHFARRRSLAYGQGFMSKALTLGHLMAKSLGWRSR